MTSAENQASWTETDRQQVIEDLGREPRGVVEVAARDGSGRVLVLTTSPRLPDGTPFPTMFYLTDPALTAACSTLEAEHLMNTYNELLSSDSDLAKKYLLAHEDYLNRRKRLGEVPEIEGISAGGMPNRVKCLHALVAHSLAAGPGVNPIGDMALREMAGRGMWPTKPSVSQRRVAAIDCGTNSIRLLIAEVNDRGIKDLVREMVITRLGQGVDRTGMLNPHAIDRTLEAARTYADQITACHVASARFVTTSASRDAANRDDFLVPISEIMGLQPQVLTGEEEAALSFAGALSALPKGLAAPYLLVDIGGGSTEFVLGSERVVQSKSVDVGSVRVTERFGGEPWSEETLTQARNFIDQKLDEAAEVVDFTQARTLVGVAGTVTSIAALVAGVREYSPLMTHGLTPTASQWSGAIKYMISAPVEEKAALGFMPTGRADVIAGGALIWERVLARFGVVQENGPGNTEFPVVVSEHDILDGLALSQTK